MRRVATKAKDAMEPVDRSKMGRASVGTPQAGVRGVGDLIEMTDEFEIGGDEDEMEGDRGRRGSEIRVGGESSSSGFYNPGAASTGAGRRERSKGDYFGKASKDD